MIVVIIKRAKSELQNTVELLGKVKRELKKNDIAKEICSEYGFDVDIIDGIPFEFVDDLEASAKTVDSAIQLNSNLVDEDFETIMRYSIHELVHSLQHMKTDEQEFSEDDGEYLDRGDEIEAFQFQIKFENEARGPDAAEEYVEDLIEYHEVPEHKEESKKNQLLEKTV